MYSLESRLVLQRVEVPDGGDLVRRGVGHAVQHHRVAHALDPGRADHPLLLQRHRLGATGPQRVHHGLDVLLVHHQLVGGDLTLLHRAVDLVLGCVAEHHRDRGAVHLLEAGRAAQGGDLVLQVADLGVVDVLAQRVRRRGSARHALLQGIGALPLLAYDRVEVGHAGGPQIQPAGREAAGHEQGAGHDEDHDGDEPPGVHRPVGRPRQPSGNLRPTDGPLAVTMGAQRGACSRVDVT